MNVLRYISLEPNKCRKMKLILNIMLLVLSARNKTLSILQFIVLYWFVFFLNLVSTENKSNRMLLFYFPAYEESYVASMMCSIGPSGQRLKPCKE